MRTCLGMNSALPPMSAAVCSTSLAAASKNSSDTCAIALAIELRIAQQLAPHFGRLTFIISVVMPVNAPDGVAPFATGCVNGASYGSQKASKPPVKPLAIALEIFSELGTGPGELSVSGISSRLGRDKSQVS